MEHQLENRTHSTSSVQTCQNCKKDFIIEPEDFSFYEKIKVPPPTWCPECRFIRRFVWRNEGNFYKSKCGLCSKDIITNYSQENPFPVYCHDCWWGDNWNALQYGQNYDFSRPFFEQFRELMNKVPALNLWAFDISNSEYSNYTGHSKNSYLSNAVYCENVAYSRSIEKSKDCIDCYMVVDSELCYESFNSIKSFNSSYLNNCRSVMDSMFLFDCSNCSNCFMSSNLRNKQFYIRNKQYSPEKYQQEIKKYDLSSRSVLRELKKEFDEVVAGGIHKFANIIKSVDSSGDYIRNSKNVHRSYIAEGENIKFCWRTTNGLKDSYDVVGCVNNELIYEASIAADNSSMAKFYSHSKGLTDSEILHLCANASNLFGCVGVKSKKYCILNKQYTKAEYMQLMGRIKQHMNEMPYVDKKGNVYKYGEFFPPEFSPFAYNETVAQEYFPLSQREAEAMGSKWRVTSNRKYQIDIPAKDIPDKIFDTDVGITGKVLGCANKDNGKHYCTEAFKVTKEEFAFYNRLGLPVPGFCSNCRHFERIKYRNPIELWHRQCMNVGCKNEFETPYAPDRPEKVYCESCYNKEVY